ncbi:MAG TPA: DUF488 domain-containing protein [Stellaceae bacterium]|nr:DUF488 domain-containing protein [Stellaceae bacterium]
MSGPAMSDKALYLIGYEKTGLAEFLATLAAAGVATVVDVRDLPLSRRAGFSKRQLQAAIEADGMRYLHLRALGTPPEGREANKRRQWERFWRIVDDKLATAEAEHALQELAAIAAAAPTCLVCYEADWHICHRRRIGEILGERHGFTLHPLTIGEAA